ncbi:MAG: Flp pilus assembly complex ATPase component TadA [Candidatus Cloacimonetes bacterium]|nr:Flp pilus assembly complex ATPase component TadA [Candidatus Cloacimonadota bacterium]
MKNFKLFGEILLDQGIVDKQTLKQALKIQNGEEEYSNRRRLGEILVTDFGVDPDKIYRTLAERYAFRVMEVSPDEITDKQLEQTKDILSKFPKEFKNKLLYNNALPFKYTKGYKKEVVVLSADPTIKLVEEIPEKTEFKKYEVVYCPLDKVQRLIKTIDPHKNEFLDILEEAGEQIDVSEEPGEEEKAVDESALDEEINKSLLVNLFEGALVEAVRKKASDVHIIPYQKNNVDIYFRIDGKLTLWFRQQNTSPEALAAVVKDRSNGIDRFEKDTAQDGFAQRRIDEHMIRFRISIMPITSEEYARSFESIVIRVIDDRNVITELSKLGFQPQAEKDFTKAITKSRGIILLTGPTGSGKSTTLMAALHHVLDPSKNVLTCEDPVEYIIKGARQLKIGHKLPFEEAIRRILRHDPDIVMVGEIRDRITADTAIKLANTGHLTLSTLHTNDAPSAISRLYKIGIEPFLLAYAINIIVAQRLVRKLCDRCKKPLSEEKYPAALDLGISEEDLEEGKIYEAGDGCEECNKGYKGRTAIAEALYFSQEVRQAIVESGEEIDEELIRKIASGQGMLSLLESGVDRIKNGLTTISEVEYATSGGD